MQTLSPLAEGNSIIHRLDPRLRIVATFAFTILVVNCYHWLTLMMALGLSGLLILTARLSLTGFWQRVVTLNLFNLLLWFILPLTVPGEAWLQLGKWVISQEGLFQATSITLKSNAVLLTITALLSTLESITLGYALHQLYVPQKLIHLFLFTVRYLAIIQEELQRLWQAMKIRGFQPRLNQHTYRSIAYLVGMLLVRSLDRSERILAAMKCRGFHGRLFIGHNFSWQWQDHVFSWLFGYGLLLLIGIEWLY
jgi:cobalt/nickel transport system permease protein